MTTPTAYLNMDNLNHRAELRRVAVTTAAEYLAAWFPDVPTPDTQEYRELVFRQWDALNHEVYLDDDAIPVPYVNDITAALITFAGAFGDEYRQRFQAMVEED